MKLQKVHKPEGLNIELPIMDLKGQDYMKVGYRVLWMVNAIKSPKAATRYTTKVEFPMLTTEQVVAQVTVTTFDDAGNQLNQVQDAATELKKSFTDYVEKATTSALGRCLAQLGFGTAQAVQDLDEGPVADAPTTPGNSTFVTAPVSQSDAPPTPARITTSFAKPKKGVTAPGNVVPLQKDVTPAPVKTSDDEWAS